ncbi:ribosomal-processing cysteine protease Prp [Neobacillus sp. SM06]|uniref:ribosomal-processing cysteine protease Prp n=1 Tax=Neobacillus sp. SM06 TaxID=3422492 RepID=UPI003D28C390
MIQITINRTKSGIIHSFTLEGHADFADHGEDIVCAGASAVSFGTVNSVIKLTGVEPDIEMGEGGFLHCVIPKGLSEEIQEKVQLLLEGMIVSLQTIEQDYGKHIKITFKQ